jgi:hypothetical protein
MLLQPAQSESSAAKIGIYGGSGTGKSLTSALLAIGLSKTYHNGAPVAMFDPEDASPFLSAVYAAEGVPLIVAKARTFVEMREALHEAESVGACCYNVDNYSEVFKEITEAIKLKLNLQGRKLPFQSREELQRVWGEWTREMRASPVHCLLAGRLAWDYGDTEDESGDVTFIKLGTKMRGESDAGYEPNLLIEMEAIRDPRRDPKSKSKRGAMIHHLSVIKDRTMILNGLTFSVKDLNQYQPGDYAKTFDKFRPHFDRLAIGGSRTAPEGVTSVVRSSAELFAAPQGESAYQARLRRITIALEDFQATSTILWPGADHVAKANRAAAIEAIYKVRSLAAAETLTAEAVEEGAALLRAYEVSVNAGQGVAMSRAAVLADLLIVEADRKETQLT